MTSSAAPADVTPNRLGAYLIALAIVGAIGIAQFFIVAHAIDDQRFIGKTVNFAGRERFLSQRIVVDAETLVRAQTPGERGYARTDLLAATNEFENRFAELASGTAPETPGGWPPAEVRAIYEQPPYSLAIEVREFGAMARELAAYPDAALRSNGPEMNYLHAFNEPLYLAFDRSVAAYAADAQGRSRNIVTLALLALVALLAGLAFVFLVILRPLERRIAAHEEALRRRYAALVSVEDGARRLAESLESESVASRFAAALNVSLGVAVARIGAEASGDEWVERARSTRGLAFEPAGFALPLAFAPDEPPFAFLTGTAPAGRPFDDADRIAAQSLFALWERSVKNARLYTLLAEREARIHDLDQLKSDLIAMLAHDFKGPLTSMIGYAQLMRDGVLEGEEIVDAANFMVDASWRLSQLASDTLTMSLLERNDLTISPTDLDLVPILRGIVKSHAGEREIRLATDVDAVHIRADAARLAQVFENLIGNAVKYSPSGAPVDVVVTLGGNEAIVAVRDRGIGIPEADRERVFERFARASNAAASSIKGTGFGLYLVKTLLELHGGAIALTSVENEGSTFTVTLPLAASQAHPTRSWSGMSVSSIL